VINGVVLFLAFGQYKFLVDTILGFGLILLSFSAIISLIGSIKPVFKILVPAIFVFSLEFSTIDKNCLCVM